MGAFGCPHSSFEFQETIVNVRWLEGVDRRLGVEPHEFRLLALMGALVATLFCAYTVAKVQRDAIFIVEYGALALPYAYVGVALASAAFVWFEGRVVRRFTRIGATRLNQYAAIVIALLAAAVFPVSRHATAAWFYLWTGSQAMILLPHFWVLALDVWDSRRARRLFPLFSACGLVGGLAGGAIAGWLTPLVKRVGLMWTLAGLLIIAHLLTRAVDSRRAHRPGPADVSTSVSRWEIVRRSTYIKFLAVALALSVIVGTLVDFQFKYFAQHAYPNPHDLTQFLGKFYAAMNAFALVLQIGAAGWILRRLDLAASTEIQPASMMLLGGWAAVTGGWWPILALRGVQGVFSQVLGKSSSEIYYMAIRPPERRSIKPAIDTLVERWSDAVVGVVLIIALRALGMSIPTIAVVTIAIAAIWLVVLWGLNRQYRRVIQQSLSTRWVDPETAAESMRVPAARDALLRAIRSEDERQIVLVLRLCQYARDPAVGRAVRSCLRHESATVRVAAVETMESMRLRDREGAIERFLGDPNEPLRRAAVGYLLTMHRRPAVFIRELLESKDSLLCHYAVDALFERPHEAPGAIPVRWIDERIGRGTRDDLLLAARALGTVPMNQPADRLRKLLDHPDVEVRRVALLSASRRPRRELLDRLVPLLSDPALSYEAREALAAVGDPAVPALQRLVSEPPSARIQALAARALAQIASPRAVNALLGLMRSPDVAARHLGYRSVSRVRIQIGQPVLPRATAHRLFLRELREYREWLTPAHQLAQVAIPEIRLLGESYGEFADMALERSVRALSCWYEPKPLFGAYERLRSRDRNAAAPALEYLGHVLPRPMFRSVSALFEAPSVGDGDGRPVDEAELARWIRSAWRSGDAWLRACAVRASRFVPALDPHEFASGDGDPAVVRAEVVAAIGSSSASC